LIYTIFGDFSLEAGASKPGFQALLRTKQASGQIGDLKIFDPVAITQKWLVLTFCEISEISFIPAISPQGRGCAGL
jgi:hypothetical protein